MEKPCYLDHQMVVVVESPHKLQKALKMEYMELRRVHLSVSEMLKLLIT